MARQNPGSKSKARSIVHGKSIGGEPGAPSIITSGSGGGGGGGGPKGIKGPGASARIKGKVKGMGGK